MALILPCLDKHPQIGEDCFIAENATIVGDVVIGNESSVWFQAVIRGDVNSIRIGKRVNIQDGAVIHCTYKRSKATIGNDVSIGHNAIVHGCTIEDNVLIGMGSIVMDHCVIGSGSIIAAGAVLLEGTKVEGGSIYAGVPAKRVKEVSKEMMEGEVKRISESYIKYASWFKDKH